MLEKNYNEILEKNFRRHFPLWDKLSPLDPVKTFAGSLSCALADVERRHERTIGALLHSLPSLFGFSPKTGQAPIGLFQIEPSSTLAEVRKFPRETRLRFGNEQNNFYLAMDPSTEIFPATLAFITENTMPEGPTFTLNLESRGTAAHLTFTFLPSDPPSADSAERISTELISIEATGRDLRGNTTHDFRKEDLRWTDTTNGFTSRGQISVRPVQGHELWGKNTREFTLQLRFRRLPPPSGTFHINVNVATLWAKETNLELGLLKAEPWEEVPLPDRLVNPPEMVSLIFPEGNSLEVRRISGELLAIRQEDPAAFSSSFYYHAGNHSLIFPSAPKLSAGLPASLSHGVSGNFRGVIRIVIPEIFSVPSRNWFESTQSLSEVSATPVTAPQVALKDNPLHSLVSQIKGLKPLAPSEARESETDYVKRFYASMRQFASRNLPQLPFQLEEIRTQVLNACPEIREVELEFRPHEKTITVYLDLTMALTAGNLGRLPQSTVQNVSELLNRLQNVPLDTQWRIAPFHTVPVYVQTEGTLDSPRKEDEVKVSELTLSHLRSKIGGTVLPSQIAFGAQPLLEELATRMMPQHPDFLVGFEQLVFRREDNGVISPALLRLPGEKFEIHLLAHWERPLLTAEARHA